MTTTQEKIQHQNLIVGTRVDYRGDVSNFPGSGVITKVYYNRNKAGIAGAGEGELWCYEMIDVTLDDGREWSVTISAFNDGPLGGTPSFSISENQEEPKPEVTVKEVVAQLCHWNIGDAPVNFTPCRINDEWFHVEVCGTWWSMTGNGGEIMVGPLNSGQYKRTVPLSSFGRNLNAATVALRVACVLRREEIDFETEVTDEEQARMNGEEPQDLDFSDLTEEDVISVAAAAGYAASQIDGSPSVPADCKIAQALVETTTVGMIAISKAWSKGYEKWSLTIRLHV